MSGNPIANFLEQGGRLAAITSGIRNELPEDRDVGVLPAPFKDGAGIGEELLASANDPARRSRSSCSSDHVRHGAQEHQLVVGVGHAHSSQNAGMRNRPRNSPPLI